MRILLADPHLQPCLTLKMSLEEQPEFDLVGEPVDGQSLLRMAKQHTVDLVLIDSDLPGMSIRDLIAYLHALEPRPIVMVMSSQAENSRFALDAGADAFISKSDNPDWLLEKLHHYSRTLYRDS